MVGLTLTVGVEALVDVGVNVASGVSVEDSDVDVLLIPVGVVCSSVEGAQAETNKKIIRMILHTFI
jgi:hypothetical protein